mmetsp:Transcript_23653/g.36501  ORF Transcript_23653/g.36501 Transcript_23653/m.36501 type:complete len:448 (-) Transcript_23653:278-1621(-)|eukprot:CAMPEP_0196815428 /NCGR_PEP_ID=MMETSP1362-20130617/49691_1 /TAXON_ID=163516 /ORGANISM="Leptocylindrus danicus, Strain CCMP1856" /LENGTH=447 /DNA_ID=CAMNT_0042192377 /DNA_START=114 /DNA_END=1457 /DNA_ORIENTATION=-
MAEESKTASVAATEEKVVAEEVVVADEEMTSTTNTQAAAAEAEDTATSGAATTPAPANGNTKSKKVYVGNLSWDVTWKELKDHMSSTGCKVLHADVLRSQGRSKGCGLVQFESADDVSKAILTLNDTELMGRPIFVREDREDHAHSGNNGEKKHSTHTHRSNNHNNQNNNNNDVAADAAAEIKSRRVYVGNLSWDVTWHDLKDHMREAGEVSFAEVMMEGHGRSKGCGIVEFETVEGAETAIQTMTDTELNGRAIFVREDREVNKGRSSTSVYVGNLSYETSWQDLKDHMRAAGNVDKADIILGHDGRSKGCGTVTYQKAQEATRAIRELQNTMLNGRPIFVREDREQGGNSRGYKNGGGNSGAGRNCQLFVSNLSFETSWKDLKEHFRQCGEVERAKVMAYPDGRNKGFGTVRYFNSKDAQDAIEILNGVDLMGRELIVKLDAKAN